MFSVGVVARQTGLDISTLRKWEVRYGFPQPARSAGGQRIYSCDDVAQLQSVVRRIATGERVGQVIRELVGTTSAKAATPAASNSDDFLLSMPAELRTWIDAALAMISREDIAGIKQLLRETRCDRAMRESVEQFLAPLTAAVGEAWAAGTLSVSSEHMYASFLESLLVSETDFFEARCEPSHLLHPRLLLIVPAGEQHTLGLSMVHAVLTEAGVACLRISSDLPMAEIAACCAKHAFRAVGLSASRNYPRRLLRAQIAELRMLLAADVELWLGGGGVDAISRLPDGTRTFGSLTELIEAARMRCGQEA